MYELKNMIPIESNTALFIMLRNIFNVSHKQVGLLQQTCHSTPTTINSTGSKIIHVNNVSEPIKLPQTCPALASQKITVIIFSVENLLLSMHRNVIGFIIQAHFDDQP